MPLTRATITRASRIMLPSYVGLFTVLGLNYTFTPKSRLLYSPGLAYAEQAMSLRVWGLLFLAAATVLTIALKAGHRTLYRFGLWVCIVTMTVWAGVLFAGALFETTSPAAWCWPAFVAVACFASNQSLLAREA